MLAGQRVDGLHLGSLAVEVDRQNGLGARGDPARGVDHVEVERVGAYVAKHRGGTRARDTAGGGEEGEARTDHLVPRADAQRHEREQDGVRTRGNAQRVPYAKILRALPLEALHLGSEDELT